MTKQRITNTLAPIHLLCCIGITSPKNTLHCNWFHLELLDAASLVVILIQQQLVGERDIRNISFINIVLQVCTILIMNVTIIK